ncbi:MAG: hypothetical protein ACOX9C_04110 [Kiritimatiellia bacterium]
MIEIQIKRGREKSLERRRKWKSRLRTFRAACSIVFGTVVLNGLAVLGARQFCEGFAHSIVEVGWSWMDVLSRMIGLSMAGAAIAWDIQLIVGFFRRAIFPKIEISVSPMRASPGEVVEVAFRVKGAASWLRRMEARLACTEVDDDCEMEDLYRETVFSSSEQKDFAKGSFSVAIPTGFPASGCHARKERAAVMWGVSFRGRTTPGFMPDVLGFAEIEVAETEG